MSAIYNTEPQPTASVILHTNFGEISVELFAKQTPLTSRNFLQHCLDGYYDNTIFHRLIPGFILQGGDPTGTGNGGESIYDGGAFAGDLDPWPMDERKGKNSGPMGINFKDEFHSRLKFNRRGLLGMANESTPDSNGSQFFFTLGKTEELNGKNTVFGRVAGDTIYNLAKMGEAEVDDGGERPLYALKLDKVEILVNPFDDMKKRQRVAPRTASAPAPVKKSKKRKVGKQLLSFGDDEGDIEEIQLPKKPKFDTRIVMGIEEDEEPAPRKSKPTKPKSATERVAKPPKAASTRDSPVEDAPPDPAIRREDLRRSPPLAERIQPRFEEQEPPETEAPRQEKTALEKANEEIAALKASMRRNIQSTEPARKESPKSEFEQMIPESSTRGRKRRPGASNGESSEELKTMSLLKAFQSKLEQVPSVTKVANSSVSRHGDDVGEKEVEDERGQDRPAGEGEVCDLHFIVDCQSCQAWDKLENKEESDDEGWMSHALNFAADRLGKDLNFRQKAEEELIVIDPREKARNIQEEKRAGRESKSGGSSRAWDQARNAQLARASALAGRGAK